MDRLSRLVHAEIVKLRTTQVYLWLLLVTVVIAVVQVIAPLAAHNGITDNGDIPDLFNSTALFAGYVVFVLGVLGVTTEFRYQTITPTVLATPSRWTIVTAKFIAYGFVGAVFAVIDLVIEVAIALPWLSSKHLDASIGHNHVPRALVGVFVVVILFGVVGLGFGALLRNQVTAVVVGLLFLIVLQNIVSIIPGVRHVYPYMPQSAAGSILGIHDIGVDGIHPLPTWGGVVTLLLWAFVPAIVGAAITMNRDIT